MGPSTSYEILIAQKLGQAPLPDLADSIWASIELELDAPLPGDDAPDAPVQNPPGKGLPGIGKLFYILVPALLITIAWLFNKNKERKKEQSGPSIQQLPATRPADSASTLTPNENSILLPAGNKKADSIHQPGQVILFPPVADSLQQLIVPPVLADSVTATKEDRQVQVKDTASLIPPAKKPRGVKGIKDSDYKIITEKKDSARKGS